MQAVQFHSDQHNIHDKIQPEHEQNQGRQTAVHIERMAVFNIDGKSIGKQIPARGCKKRAWKLFHKTGPSAGQNHIQQRKKEREQGQHDHHTKRKKDPGKDGQKGKINRKS